MLQKITPEITIMPSIKFRMLTTTSENSPSVIHISYEVNSVVKNNPYNILKSCASVMFKESHK